MQTHPAPRHLQRAAAGVNTRADVAPDDALIRQPEAKRLAGGISAMTLWRWRRAGLIPEPLSIRGKNYWRRAEFMRALEAAAQPDQAAA